MTRYTAIRLIHRATALGFAAVMSIGILGSINLLAVAPEPDSLLAQRSAPAQVAATPASASLRS